MNLRSLISESPQRSDARPLDVNEAREAEREGVSEWVLIVAGVPAALIVLAISYTFWGAVTGWSSLSDTWKTFRNLLPETLQGLWSPLTFGVLLAVLLAFLVAVFTYQHLCAKRSEKIRREFLDRYEVFRRGLEMGE